MKLTCGILLPAGFPGVIAAGGLPFPRRLLCGGVFRDNDGHAVTDGIESARNHSWTVRVELQRRLCTAVDDGAVDAALVVFALIVNLTYKNTYIYTHTHTHIAALFPGVPR